MLTFLLACLMAAIIIPILGVYEDYRTCRNYVKGACPRAWDMSFWEYVLSDAFHSSCEEIDRYFLGRYYIKNLQPGQIIIDGPKKFFLKMTEDGSHYVFSDSLSNIHKSDIEFLTFGDLMHGYMKGHLMFKGQARSLRHLNLDTEFLNEYAKLIKNE